MIFDVDGYYDINNPIKLAVVAISFYNDDLVINLPCMHA